MAIKNFSFAIDTIKSNLDIVATVKQLDNVIFNISVTENGLAKDLTNQTVQLFMRKADGSLVVQTDNIIVANPTTGVVQINVINGAFSTVGLTVGELDIEGKDGDISTSVFSFNVVEKIGSNQAIENEVNVNLFNQIVNTLNQATTEIQQYKAFFNEFTSAGVSVQGLADVKTYIDNSLSNLKTDSTVATNLDSELKTTITSANTIQTSLEQTIASANNNANGYLTSTTLTPILDKFTPYMQWNGISSADCNTLTKGGFYSINAMTVDLSTTHFPLSGEWGLLLVSETQGGTDGGTVIQIFYGLTSTRLFYRMFNANAWRDWTEFVTTTTLRTNLDALKTTLEAEITNINLTTNKITQSLAGLTLDDTKEFRSYDVNRTVNNVLGTARVGVNEFGNPTAVLEFLKDNNLFLTLEMLTTSEFKLKDSAGSGTTALLFTDKNGDTDKGWIGKYVGGDFTVKSNTNNLILTNNYGSHIVVGQGGYFYPSASYQWALGKDGNRWTTVYCSSVNQTSDKRLKENIEYLQETPRSVTDSSITLEDLYEFINKDLRLSTYDYKETVNLNSDERQNLQGKLGFIAQDLQPSAVGQSVLIPPKTADGYLAYDLNNYINVLAGALQMTIHKVEAMNSVNQLTALSSIRNQVLGKQISQLMLQNLQVQQRLTELESKVNKLTATTVAENNTTNGGNINGTK